MICLKDELAIVIDDHGKALMIEAVVLEANEAIISEVRTHRRIGVVSLNYEIYHRRYLVSGAKIIPYYIQSSTLDI